MSQPRRISLSCQGILSWDTDMQLRILPVNHKNGIGNQMYYNSTAFVSHVRNPLSSCPKILLLKKYKTFENFDRTARQNALKKSASEETQISERA